MNQLEVLFKSGVKEIYEFDASSEDVLKILNIIIDGFSEGVDGYITLPSEDNWGTIIRINDISRVKLLNKLE